MDAIKNIVAGGIYVFQSSASANSTYFETDELIKVFFKYCNYYLNDYLTVYDYSVGQDGWIMVVKLKSRKTIRKSYREQLRMKNRDIESVGKMEIWRIISERMRLFISTYVRLSNKILGRTGSLVRRKYERYEFTNQDEAITFISKLRNHEVKQIQYKNKYRSLKQHYRLSSQSRRSSLLTSSIGISHWVKQKRFRSKICEVFGAGCKVIRGCTDLVVLNNILSLNSKHTP